METLPIKLFCDGLHDFPLAETLVDLADRGNHVEVCLASSSDEEQLRHEMRRLSEALPDHAVHVCRSDLVKVRFVVSRNEILENRLCFVLAARNFRLLGNALASVLAKKLKVTAEELSKADFRCRHFNSAKSLWQRLQRVCFGSKMEGRLNRHWGYYFHGYEVCFHSRKGLVLDINLGFSCEFGTLDPWFFADFTSGVICELEIGSILEPTSTKFSSFMRASRVHEEVNRLLELDYCRASLALEILELAGEFECLEPTDRKYRNPKLIVR